MEEDLSSTKIRKVPKLHKYHPTNEEYDYFKKIQEDYEKTKKKNIDHTKNNDNENRKYIFFNKKNFWLL